LPRRRSKDFRSSSKKRCPFRFFWGLTKIFATRNASSENFDRTGGPTKGQGDFPIAGANATAAPKRPGRSLCETPRGHWGGRITTLSSEYLPRKTLWSRLFWFKTPSSSRNLVSTLKKNFRCVGQRWPPAKHGPEEKGDF